MTATRWLAIFVCGAFFGCDGGGPSGEVVPIVRLAGDPTALAVDADNVYVTSSRFESSISWGFIERAPKGGGNPETIAEAAPTTSLVLDEDAVYFMTYDDGPLRVDKGGGVVTAISAVPCAACWDLALDAETIYFTEWFGDEGVVRSIPKEPSSDSTVLASDFGLPLRLVIDETHVYWGNQAGEVWSVAKAGGDSLLLATSAGLADFVALDAEFVYFTSGGRGTGAGRVSRVPKQGGPVEILAEVTNATGAVRGLAIANARVYVGTDEGIVSLPLTGGDTTMLSGTESVGNDIETDGEFIYWISESGNDVHRRAVEGTGGG
jgi:hypothetical protein